MRKNATWKMLQNPLGFQECSSIILYESSSRGACCLEPRTQAATQIGQGACGPASLLKPGKQLAFQKACNLGHRTHRCQLRTVLRASWISWQLSILAEPIGTSLLRKSRSGCRIFTLIFHKIQNSNRARMHRASLGVCQHPQPCTHTGRTECCCQWSCFIFKGTVERSKCQTC